MAMVGVDLDPQALFHHQPQNALHLFFKAVKGQMKAPALVEVPQGQRQMAHHLELSPSDHLLHLLQIIPQPLPGLRLIPRCKERQIAVRRRGQTVNGTDDKIQLRCTRQLPLRPREIPGSIPQFHPQAQPNPSACGSFGLCKGSRRV